MLAGQQGAAVVRPSSTADRWSANLQVGLLVLMYAIARNESTNLPGNALIELINQLPSSMHLAINGYKPPYMSAVLYTSAFASLCKRQPPIIQVVS
jgi:hypothetical protein